MPSVIKQLSHSDVEIVNKFNAVISSLTKGKWILNREHEHTVNQFGFSSCKHSASRFFYLNGQSGTCSVVLFLKPRSKPEISGISISVSGVISDSLKCMTDIKADTLTSMSVSEIVAAIEMAITKMMKANGAVEINPYDIGANIGSAGMDEVNMLVVGCDYRDENGITDIKVVGFDSTVNGSVYLSHNYEGKQEMKVAGLVGYIHAVEAYQNSLQVKAA